VANQTSHWRVPFEAEHFEGSHDFYFQKPLRLACPFGEEDILNLTLVFHLKTFIKEVA